MKAVKTINLEAEAQPKATKTPAKKGKSLVRRTYSLYSDDDKLINDTASILSKKKGKPASASEALRYLLDQARAQS